MNNLFPSKGAVMNLKRMFFGMAFALYLITGTGQNVQAKDWQWQRVPGTNAMFDTARITSISSSILRVWTKEILDKKVIDEYHKNEPRYFSDYSYSIILNQIDCKEQLKGWVSWTDYDSSGGSISFINRTDSEIKMIPVISGSSGALLMKAACKYAKKAPKKKKRGSLVP